MTARQWWRRALHPGWWVAELEGLLAAEQAHVARLQENNDKLRLLLAQANRDARAAAQLRSQLGYCQAEQERLRALLAAREQAGHDRKGADGE